MLYVDGRKGYIQAIFESQNANIRRRFVVVTTHWATSRCVTDLGVMIIISLQFAWTRQRRGAAALDDFLTDKVMYR